MKIRTVEVQCINRVPRSNNSSPAFTEVPHDQRQIFVGTLFAYIFITITYTRDSKSNVYDKMTVPMVFNEFGAAAFRVGHTQVPKTVE